MRAIYDLEIKDIYDLEIYDLLFIFEFFSGELWVLDILGILDILGVLGGLEVLGVLVFLENYSPLNLLMQSMYASTDAATMSVLAPNP